MPTVINDEMRAHGALIQVDAGYVVVPVGQLPGIAGGVAGLQVIPHRVDVTAHPHDRDFSASLDAAALQPLQPRFTCYFLKERRGDNSGDPKLKVVENRVEQAAVFQRPDLVPVDRGLPVVRVGIQRQQQALGQRPADGVLVQQGPAGDLADEPGELGLTRSRKAGDQDQDGCAFPGAAGTPRRQDPFLQITRGEDERPAAVVGGCLDGCQQTVDRFGDLVVARVDRRGVGGNADRVAQIRRNPERIAATGAGGVRCDLPRAGGESEHSTRYAQAVGDAFNDVEIFDPGFPGDDTADARLTEPLDRRGDPILTNMIVFADQQEDGGEIPGGARGTHLLAGE